MSSRKKASPAAGKAAGAYKGQHFKRKLGGKKLGRRGEGGAGMGGGKLAVKIGTKRRPSAGVEATKKQKCENNICLLNNCRDGNQT